MPQDATPPFQLTEQDIKRIFRHPPKWLELVSRLWHSGKFLGNFLVVFAVFFVVLNFPAYYQRIVYLVTPKPAGKLTLPDREKVIEQLEKNELPAKTNINPAQFIVPTFTEPNRIVIPKIGLDAPVLWDVPLEQLIERLRDGVTHYKDTALPGEVGNIFITGHSSNFWWDKGRFNQIFVLLDKLAPGDDIFINYDGKTYHFVVEKSVIVKPTNIEVLNPTDRPVLTLMTCNPVGTTINRLIVQAKQVTPLEARTAQDTKPSLPTTLPAIR